MDAINEEVFAHVLGQGKDPDELWQAYARSLRVFPHLLRALGELYDEISPPPKVDPKRLAKAIADQTELLVPGELDVARMVQVALRNLRRCKKVVARLQKRDIFDAFLETQHGRMWISAAYAFPWAVFGLRYMGTDLHQFSKEDVFFCLTLLEAGARDSFSFPRAFELDLADQAEPEDIEVGEMPEDLAQIEAQEFEEAERLLERVEQGASVGPQCPPSAVY